MNEQEQRAAVVAEAKTWLGTKYHHEGKIKGAGVDCLTLLAASFEKPGLVPKVKLPHYPFDWHLHHGIERYMNGLLEYSVEVDGPPTRMPQPADVVLWKIGRAFSHGALVIEWPMIIHAQVNVGCVLENVENATWLYEKGETGPDKGTMRPVKFFMLKEWN